MKDKEAKEKDFWESLLAGELILRNEKTGEEYGIKPKKRGRLNKEDLEWLNEKLKN